MTVDPHAGRKLRMLVDTLASEYSSVEGSKGAAIVDTFLTDEAASEVVQDIIGDIVFRFLFAGAQQFVDLLKTNSSSEAFDSALDHFISTKTRLTGDLAKRLRQHLKQAVLASEEQRPKSERRDRLKQKQRNKHCYLCGGPINDDPILDHVWPRSAGGGTGKSNLRVAHPFCEAIKADYAVCGDAPVGRFAFNALPRTLEGRSRSWWSTHVSNNHDFKSLVDDIRGSQLTLAVLGRQHFQCHACRTPFEDVNSCLLKRRNEDEPWWFANVFATCDQCA